MGQERAVSRRRPGAGRPRASRGAWRWILGLLAIVAASAWLSFELHGLPSAAQIAKLKAVPLRESALMRARQEQAALKRQKLVLRQSWVDYPRIAPAVIAAVVASEDARFFEHRGLDLKEIHNALHDSLSGSRSLRGASTLTQQLAKNVWLSGDRSLVRKLKEALLARRLEEQLSKRRILTLYLNLAEWGEGVFGIEAAAQAWCGKDASQLSLAEAAALASMLPNPHRFTPKSKALLFRRASHVLDRVAEEKLAAPQEVDVARTELARWLGQPLPANAEPVPETAEEEEPEPGTPPAEVLAPPTRDDGSVPP
jgi:monofunctional biosynthetic peptidoglycan transglycosylase